MQSVASILDQAWREARHRQEHTVLLKDFILRVLFQMLQLSFIHDWHCRTKHFLVYFLSDTINLGQISGLKSLESLHSYLTFANLGRHLTNAFISSPVFLTNGPSQDLLFNFQVSGCWLCSENSFSTSRAFQLQATSQFSHLRVWRTESPVPCSHPPPISLLPQAE